jgi:hypothetical protein
MTDGKMIADNGILTGDLDMHYETIGRDGMTW